MDYEHRGGQPYPDLSRYAESASALLDCQFAENMRPPLLPVPDLYRVTFSAGARARRKIQLRGENAEETACSHR